ncbi:MAG: hypothetical protein HPY74_17375 [Firmicutes bacterium]|nr:DUF6431 domain-containing protein [Desulfobacterales bacterium]NSW92408.1 hypothetical protein [Bacillota bacterium]
MINIKEYELVPHKKVKNKYHVKSKEKSICPVCSSPELKVAGTRSRKVIKSCGEKLILVIRRLRCSNCRRIHHELLDNIVPYKRYSSKSIEAILDSTEDTVSCEESTIYRIRKWFGDFSGYLAGCLDAIAARWSPKVITGQLSFMRRIKAHVGCEARWLARAVRPLVNLNLWVHTRSAFLS